MTGSSRVAYELVRRYKKTELASLLELITRVTCIYRYPLRIWARTLTVLTD
jgi:hypothetical protein